MPLVGIGPRVGSPVVVEDTLQGSGEAELSRDGFVFRRSFLVYNMTIGIPTARPYLAMYRSGVARRGDAHPNAIGHVADLVEVEMIDPETYRVNVSYVPQTLFSPTPTVDQPSRHGEATLTVSSSVQQVTTNFDVNGNPIVVAYFPTPSIGTLPGGLPIPLFHVAEVQKSVAMMTISYSRMESQDPSDLARKYVGTVNSRPLFDGMDWKHTWLCTSINGQTVDKGATYGVTYDFARAPLGEDWNAIVVFTKDGKIPDDIKPPTRNADGSWTNNNVTGVAGTNGVVAGIRVHPEKDFYALNLTI